MLISILICPGGLRIGETLNNAVYRRATGVDSRIATVELLRAVGRGTASAKEIADRTGIPVKTVRHRLKRTGDEGSIQFTGSDD